MKTMRLLLVFIAALAAIVIVGRAQTVIPIANGGFESPSTSTTANFAGGDWQSSANHAIINFSLLSSVYNGGVVAPEGSQIGYINAVGSDNSIFQDVGVNFVTGASYTFSAYFGRRTDGTNPTVTGSVQLLTSTGALLASTVGIAPTTGANFLVASVTYVATGAENGYGIRVKILNEVSGAQLNFDNAQLTTIPEPSTYAGLTGAAALGLALFLRRCKLAAC